MYRRLSALVAAVLWLAPAVPAAAARPATLLRDFPRGTLVIETAGPRCLRIAAWFADAPEQQAQGLMFVEQLDEFEGMLFRYPRDAIINMWMKNTLIPLDMVFVAADGSVTRVTRDTTPMSTRRISSGGAVTGVLELNAGFTARWRIEAGSRLLLVD